MRLPLLGPALVLAGLLWRGIALGCDSRIAPGVAVALFAGLLLRKGWAIAATLALLLGSAVWEGLFRQHDPFSWNLAWEIAALPLGGLCGFALRADPRWWKIVGVVLVLGFNPGNAASLAADLGYAVFSLSALAFVLRAGKRGGAGDGHPFGAG